MQPPGGSCRNPCPCMVLGQGSDRTQTALIARAVTVARPPYAFEIYPPYQIGALGEITQGEKEGWSPKQFAPAEKFSHSINLLRP
jgi:hypothetical protein